MNAKPSAWVGLLAVLAVTVACGGAEPPVAAAGGGAVTVDGGSIAGAPAGDGGVWRYAGIPYAAPPVGALRWRPPQPVEPWADVRQADQLPPGCPQPTLPVPPDAEPFFGPGATRLEEDCLYLNVWSAAGPDERVPVMVWIHGGGLFVGDGSTAAYDGAALARRGVVVVTINYRLGALGYLAHPLLREESAHGASGNYGLLDQIAALEWVQRNVAAFGGDPDRVTIFGESAGSWSVNYLLATPLAAGLFAGAIGQSGGGFSPLASLAERDAAEAEGERFAEALLGAETAVSLDALRSAAAADVLAADGAAPRPNVDGWALTDGIHDVFAAGRQHDVPVIVGANADEGTALRALAGGREITTVEEYRAWARGEYGDLADAYLAAYPAASDADAAGGPHRQQRRRPLRVGDADLGADDGAGLVAGLSLLLHPRAARRRRRPLRRVSHGRDPVRLQQPRRRRPVLVREPRLRRYGPAALRRDGLLLGELRRDRESERRRPAGMAGLHPDRRGRDGARRRRAGPPGRAGRAPRLLRAPLRRPPRRLQLKSATGRARRAPAGVARGEGVPANGRRGFGAKPRLDGSPHGAGSPADAAGQPHLEDA